MPSNLPASRELTCEVEIIGTRGRIRRSGGDVSDDDGRRVREERSFEDLPGLCSGYSYVAEPVEGQRRASVTVAGPT